MAIHLLTTLCGPTLTRVDISCTKVAISIKRRCQSIIRQNMKEFYIYKKYGNMVFSFLAMLWCYKKSCKCYVKSGRQIGRISSLHVICSPIRCLPHVLLNKLLRHVCSQYPKDLYSPGIRLYISTNNVLQSLIIVLVLVLGFVAVFVHVCIYLLHSLVVVLILLVV